MFSFDAKYLLPLSLFVAKADVRYYLMGYAVMPSPRGGALIAATNGHVIAIAHDPDGYCSGEEFIIKDDAQMVKQAKAKKGNPGRFVYYDGTRVTIRINSTPPMADDQGREIWAAPAPGLIDGEFPKFNRVIPKDLSDYTLGLTQAIDPAYMQLPGQIATKMGYSSRWDRFKSVRFFSPPNKNTSVLFSMTGDTHLENMLFQIMPMRDDTEVQRPDTGRFFAAEKEESDEPATSTAQQTEAA